MTDTMPAAVYIGPGQVEVQERPVPEPGPGEILIEVDHCGVCGSDLHMMIDGWGQPGSIEGHEYAGRVARLGPGVDGWALGDPVIGGPEPSCGVCRHCRAGRPSLCAERGTPGTTASHGAFAGFKLLRADAAVPVPEGLSLLAAALAEPLAVALHAISQAGVEPGGRVMVFGAGPIGALAIAALRARGIDDVTVCEPAPLRQDLARRAGATRIVTPGDLHDPGIGDPGGVVDGAVDAVLECSGKAAAMQLGLAQLERGGTLVLVGAGLDPPQFDPNRIMMCEPVITGAYCYDADGFPAALALLASGDLPLDALVEPGAVPLDGLLDAMRSLAAGEIAGKVLVAPGS